MIQRDSAHAITVKRRGQVELPLMPDSDISSAPRAPNPLLAGLGRVLEAALNRLVDLDVDTRARMAALEGRAVTLDIRNTALALRVEVADGRLRVGPAFGGDSALRVAATPASLLALAFARRHDGGLAPGMVEIGGDAELARRLQQIATRFAPDVDAVFTRVFGDVLGFQIARSLRRGLAGARNATHALAQDAAEFLSEEGRDVVAKAELDTFLDEVDALRERADRLDARVHRVQATRA